MARLHRIHVKATRNGNNVHWGNMYPMQLVDADLASRAGVPTCQNEWDRHNYEAMLPGFGGSDSMDWRAFVNTLQEREFKGPFEIENEAALSKGTGNMGAILQGFKAATLNLAPMLWPLTGEGYQYNTQDFRELKTESRKDIPVVTMKDIQG
jgi:sugar phosphate isomerase/epimerase